MSNTKTRQNVKVVRSLIIPSIKKFAAFMI